MLFEKIRRTQKPVFIFLGAVFALSFVFLGVGSGVGGISLGDLLGTNTSSGTASISSLNDQVRQNPKDSGAWLRLADAYELDGQADPALGAYLQYLQLKPKDVNTTSRVAGLYETRASQLSGEAQSWQTLASQYQPTSGLLPSSADKLTAAFPSSLVTSAQQPYQQKSQTLQQQAQGDVSQAVALWKKAIALSPEDSTLERSLYRDALFLQDYATAYDAVKRVLVLEPDAPDKKQLQSLLKQLKPLAHLNSGSGTTTPSAP
jgi:tetratricopeptide (TPR) repeat protein